MKLKTKIAGSLALPLALAVAANSAQAFTVVDNADQKVTIGGYLSAITSWSKEGNKNSAPTAHKFNNDFSAGTSRLNIGYTDKETGTRFFYEQQFVTAGQTNGLRHAYFETEDGIVGGHTWSFGTNLVALAETIDTDGNSLVSYQVFGPRNLLLGKKFKLDDSMTVGVALEQKKAGDDREIFDMDATDPTATEFYGVKTGAHKKSVLPALVVNFQGQFGDAKVFAAWTNYAVNVSEFNEVWDTTATPVDLVSSTTAYPGKDKRLNRLTFGTDIALGDAANLKLGLTQNFGLKYQGQEISGMYGADAAKGTHVSAALGFKVNEKVRTNLVTEYSKWNKKAINKGVDVNGDDINKAGTAYRVWLNAFYQADNGIEWGAEYQIANIKADQWYDANGVQRVGMKTTSNNGLGHKGQALRLQAKYAF